MYAKQALYRWATPSALLLGSVQETVFLLLCFSLTAPFWLSLASDPTVLPTTLTFLGILRQSVSTVSSSTCCLTWGFSRICSGLCCYIAHWAFWSILEVFIATGNDLLCMDQSILCIDILQNCLYNYPLGICSAFSAFKKIFFKFIFLKIYMGVLAACKSVCAHRG